MSAKDLGTGNEQKITITASSGLSEEDIERMMKDAESHADEDRKAREVAEARTTPRTSSTPPRSRCAKWATRSTPSTKTQIETAAAELKKALDGDDVADIQAKTDALMQASHKLAEAVYQQAQQQRQPTGDEGAEAGPQDENVEEADYEVIDEDEQK